MLEDGRALDALGIIILIGGAMLIVVKVITLVIEKYRAFDENSRMKYERARLAESQAWLEQHNSLHKLEQSEPKSGPENRGNN